ncbi:MAG: hypothetical protein Q9187_004232 [Circinaria calcarea]
MEKVGQEATDDMSDAEVQAVMTKNHVADDTGLPFFHVVINPRSFGQTVENLFYVSFLIRDGYVGFGQDSRGLPTLHIRQPRDNNEIREKGVSKHQAVFHLDFPTWEDIVQAYEIDNCIIPHRQSDQGAQVSATGWYA